mgnify:CR=1 FL=1
MNLQKINERFEKMKLTHHNEMGTWKTQKVEDVLSDAQIVDIESFYTTEIKNLLQEILERINRMENTTEMKEMDGILFTEGFNKCRSVVAQIIKNTLK